MREGVYRSLGDSCVVHRELTWCKEFDKGMLVSIDELNEDKQKHISIISFIFTGVQYSEGNSH